MKKIFAYLSRSKPARTCFLFFLASLPAHSFAQQNINPEHAGHQDSVPEYKVEIIRNNPENEPILNIELYPITLSIPPGAVGSTVGAEIEVKKHLKSNLTLFSSFTISGALDSYEPFPTEPFYHISMGNVFYTSAKTREDTAKIWMYGKTGNSLILRMQTRKVHKTGIRTSLNYLSTIISNDRVNFIGYLTNDIGKSKLNLSTNNKASSDTFGNYGYSTTMIMPYFSIGIVNEVIGDMAIKLDGYGKRDITRKSLLYADLLISPYVHYGDIALVENHMATTSIINVDKYSPKSYIGFRAGWEISSLRRFGTSFNAEFCYLPNAGAYINLKFGLESSLGKRM